MNRFVFLFRIFLSSLLFLCVVTSCDDGREDELFDRMPVTFSPGISSTLTRVVDQSWYLADRVGIYMYPEGKTLSDRLGFETYKPSASGTSATLGPVGNSLYYPMTNQKVGFVAFCPYQAPSADYKVTYNTFSSQGTSNLNAMQAVDLIYAKTPATYSYSSAPVKLTFEHQFTKLKVVVQRGDQVASLNNLTLTVDNMPTTASYSLNDESQAYSGTTNITFYKEPSSTADLAVFTAIVAPHDKRDHTFTFNGVTSPSPKYKLTAPVYAKNKCYEYKFTLSPQGVSLTNSDISIWDSGHVEWSGNKYLSTDKLVSVGGDAAQVKVSVKTNVENFKYTLSGSAVGLTTAPSWITFSSNSSNGDTHELLYNVSANSGSQSRPAYVHLEANNFKIVVTIEQTTRGATIDPNFPVYQFQDANCYILPPGGAQLLIPIERADIYASLYKDATIARLGENEDFFAEVFWSDGSANGASSGVVAAGSVIRKVDVVGRGPSGYIYVQSGFMPGNAVVTLRRGSATGTILWSWHIWVTNYNPEHSIMYNPLHPVGQYYMDRNLGAFSATPGDPGSMGLLYQWGRKDPFPGGTNFAQAAVGKTIWYKNGSGYSSTAAVDASATTDGVSVTMSIQNPRRFYTRSGDWCSTDQNTYLRWSNLGGKSIDDPCPSGWKVPPFDVEKKVSPWQGLTADNMPAVYRGRGNADVGYYPFAGLLSGGSGAYANVGTYGYYWSATWSSATNAYRLYINGSGVSPSYGSNRSGGLSVRCVPE